MIIVRAREASLAEKFIFWVLLIANGMISASDFLLASAAANFITIARMGFSGAAARFARRYLTE